MSFGCLLPDLACLNHSCTSFSFYAILPEDGRLQITLVHYIAGPIDCRLIDVCLINVVYLSFAQSRSTRKPSFRWNSPVWS